MKPMHYTLALSAAIAVAGLAFTANPAAAANGAMADCNKQWNEATAAKTTNGVPYQDYLKACLKKASEARASGAAATTTTAAAPADATAATPAAAPVDPAIAKAKKACAAAYKTAKDDGSLGTEKKKDFIAACMANGGKAPATAASDSTTTAPVKKPMATTETPPATDTTTTAPVKKPVATTATESAAPAEPTDTPAKTTTASGKPKTAGQLAMDVRIKECGTEWKKAKADGTTGGLKWPQYWSACNKRLKAATTTN